jgi:hypothetical protein
VIGRHCTNRPGIHPRIPTADQVVHRITWPEGHDVPGGGDELLDGAGVAGRARGPPPDLEDAEAPQLDPALDGEGADDLIEGPLDDPRA